VVVTEVVEEEVDELEEDVEDESSWAETDTVVNASWHRHIMPSVVVVSLRIRTPLKTCLFIVARIEERNGGE
jgi:hypothetical protein